MEWLKKAKRKKRELIISALIINSVFCASLFWVYCGVCWGGRAGTFDILVRELHLQAIQGLRSG